MLRAYDIMTRAVATVTPNTSTGEVARLMRDLNIGDVLVVEDGKLKGIVTDRDLALQVLTNGASAQSPVEPYMTTDVITGQPDWTLKQIADVMGKYQIRRLPIVQHGSVVGIVSLGDVAVHMPKTDKVGESLKNISEGTRLAMRRVSPLPVVVGLAVPAVLATVMYLLSNKKSQRWMRQQWQASHLSDKARTVLNDTRQSLQNVKLPQDVLNAVDAVGIADQARESVQERLKAIQDPKVRKRALKLAKQASRRKTLPDYVAQLVKPKPKRFWFA